MAVVRDDSLDDPDFDDAHLGEVPAGVGGELYAKRLEGLSRQEAFGEGVLSITDTEGGEQEIPLDEVAGTEHDHETNRTKIRLRNGAIVVVSGAVIAAAVATIRYRRKHKQ